MSTFPCPGYVPDSVPEQAYGMGNAQRERQQHLNDLHRRRERPRREAAERQFAAFVAAFAEAHGYHQGQVEQAFTHWRSRGVSSPPADHLLDYLAQLYPRQAA